MILIYGVPESNKNKGKTLGVYKFRLFGTKLIMDKFTKLIRTQSTTSASESNGYDR